jgi:hypothetical protein
MKTNSGGGESVQNAMSSVSQAAIRRAMNNVFVIIQYKPTKCTPSTLRY